MSNKQVNVVIVGKPNVGKSTLFNRIVRRRIAITTKESGTTRDRIRIKTDWQGIEFLLTDTGGFVSKDKSEITKKVNEQIRKAVLEADVIIFLVDGSAMPTLDDYTINEWLRKTNKPYIVAINKIDRKESKDNLSEFYKFGVKDLIEISAEHGQNVAELLDLVISKLAATVKPKEEITKEKDKLNLLIIGRPNVGKSMLVNAILAEERVIVSEQAGTTRDAIEEEFVLDNQHFRIIDTAGLRKKSKINKQIEYFSIQRVIRYIPKADVIILLLDAKTDNYPPNPLTRQDKAIIDLVLRKGKAIVIGINKIDLIAKDEQKYLLNNTKVALRNFNFIPVLLISALKKQGIVEIIRKALDVYEEGLKKISDDLLAQTVLPRLHANLPSHRIKYLYLKQKGVLPPKFDLVTNLPQDVKESYLRFVANEIRNYFGFEGNNIHIKVVRKS